MTERTVKPEQWGKFLIAIFDEWVAHDVGDMFIQLFESQWLPGWACRLRSVFLPKPAATL